MTYLTAYVGIQGYSAGGTVNIKLWKGSNLKSFVICNENIDAYNVLCDSSTSFAQFKTLNADSPLVTSKIEMTNLYANGRLYLKSPPPNIPKWEAGEYKLEVVNGGSTKFPICEYPFTILDAETTTNACKINIFPKSGIKPGTQLTMTVTSLTSPKYDSKHRFKLFRNNALLNPSECPTYKQLSEGVPIGIKSVGDYRIEIKNSCRFNEGNWTFEGSEKTICTGGFSVRDDAAGGSVTPQTGGGGVAPTPNYPTPPCKKNLSSAKCETALGDIDVSKPENFITTVFTFILGIGGAATLILLIYAGYVFMTSRGDKQKIQGARETIISAITGLIFIVLAIAILGFLGATLFDIPGFG